MNSLLQNPYQITLTSELVQRRREGVTSHLILKDSILMDYTRLGLPIERASLSGLHLIRTYTSGGKLVHVVQGAPSSSKITTEVDPQDRMNNQRDITLRLLTSHALSYYFNRHAFDFRRCEIPNVPSTQVTFLEEDQPKGDDPSPSPTLLTIHGHFTREETLEMIRVLQDRIDRVSRAGLQIKTSREDNLKTAVFGLFSGPWIGPHLASTAEIGPWSLKVRSLAPDSLTLEYQLL